jgi:exopolysaccharide biosynthesis polyprenyl glycosylphosphotransferase
VIRLSWKARVFVGTLDLVGVSVLFSLAYVLRFYLEVGAVVDVPPAPPRSYLEALLVVLGVFHLVFRGRGLYDSLPPRGIDVLEQALQATSLASVIVLAASFYYRDFTYSRSVSLISWGLCVMWIPLPRLLLMRRRRRLWGRSEGLHPALVVGTLERACGLLDRIANRRYFGIAPVGLVLPEGADPQVEAPIPILGTTSELARAVRETKAREVLVCDTLERLELLAVVEICEELRVETRVVPAIYDLFVTPQDLTQLHGVPLVSVRERRFQLVSRALKRAFDLVVGGGLLLAALPLLAFLAWRIRRGSPGPALYRQRRVGEGGRVFSMWKLRSMVVDAEARLGDLVDLDDLEAPVFKLQDDPRVTPTGRWLRRWSLDELPQLWNVARGDMSLVGPRPEEESVVARYDAHQRRRLKAKPGLTGLQQIEARASPDLDERVRLDVFYIRRRTFLFDLYILGRTPLAVVRGEGAT